nr:8737_t:CDS:2 [Entrophospora candida]
MIHEFPDPPNIKNSSVAIMKNLFQSFRNACDVTLDFENEYFENIVGLVQRCRQKFHTIANDTIEQSDNLVRFGGDIMVFFKHYSDEAASKEDILDYLNRLLNDAITNQTAIEKTNSKIKTLKDDMTMIRNELREFDFGNMKNIDPTTYNNLKDAESKKNLLNKMSKGAFILGGIFLTATLPVTGVALAGAALVSAAGAKAAGLRKTLNLRQGQVINKSNSLLNNVTSITPSLNDLKNFWDTHIAELERLIDRFKFSGECRSRPSRLFIGRFEIQWKETIEECKHYSDITKNELDNDVLNLNQNN